MLRRAFVPIVSLSLFVACGGAPPPATPTDAVRTAPGGSAPPAAIATAPSAARRGASDALKKAWPFDDTKLVVYADVDGLMHTPLVNAVMKSVLVLFDQSATPVHTKCLQQALAGAKEVALGADAEWRSLVALRVDPATSAWIGECLQRLVPDAKPMTMRGAVQAWSVDGVGALTADGLFLSGSKEAVERALLGTNDGASLAAVTLGAGEYVAFRAAVFGPARPITGTILATDERFRISGDGDVPTTKFAEQVEKELDATALAGALPAAGLKPEEREALGKLMKAFSVKRDGRHLAVAFDLHEPPVEQARDLGAAAALGIYGVRKYISNAKQAEAKNVLGELAKDVVMDWEGERPDGKPRSKKKLVSFGPVPKTVPRGVKYQSSEADWKPWAPLRFSMIVPQYYQYEIKAAKDGESAEIIARGDLNGDGRTSQFKLSIKVDRTTNALRVAPTIAETDPDE